MRSTFLFTSALALVGIASANWMPVAGPINPGFEPHAFDVVENGVTIGTVQLDSSPGTAHVGTGPGTLLYITNSMLFASISDTPHAFLNFPNNGLTCGDTGDVVFTVSDTNKCAESSPFALTSEGHIAFHSGTGTFLVCGSNNHLVFNKNAVAPKGCSAVQLIVAE